VRPKPQRRALHAIYLLHDLLHHAKYHTRDVQQHTTLVQASQNRLYELFHTAATGGKARINQRLQKLLELWEIESYFSPQQLSVLRDATSDNPTQLKPDGGTSSEQKTAEVPYIMPAMHGDPSLPYHELPTGNYIPHIIPKKAIAMRPEDIRPLQFRPGPADESLINAVKDFLRDVDMMDNQYQRLEEDGIAAEIDDLGQLSWRNEVGDLVGDTYYGWSRQFCEKMQAKRKPADKMDGGRGRSSSFDSRSSRSQSPRKRRRLSNSSRGSSPDQSLHRPYDQDRSKQQTSRSRSVSPALFISMSDVPRNDRDARTHQSITLVPPPASIAPPDHTMHYLPPPPFGPNGFPLPPPRPPNWNGPWPPPPPPPPPGPFRQPFGYR
jgi:hypothetical protein